MPAADPPPGAIARPDPDRALADLRKLRDLTGGPAGAERLAWTEGWRRARDFLRERLREIGVGDEVDEAGNLWAGMAGSRPGRLGVGSHLDAVPEGGWLDGALGVMAGLELLRAVKEAGAPPPRGLVLVDFADEEGARFGRSLFGSSAVAGRLVAAEVAELRDADGTSLVDALAENGVDLALAGRARSRADDLVAYLELHIEQGPVLEAERLPVAPVRGAMGIARRRWSIIGQAGHAGTTPLRLRRDPMLVAARAIVALRELALAEDARATVGSVEATPGVATAIPGRVEFTVDLRHESAVMLERLGDDFADVVEALAAEGGCTASAAALFDVAPTAFDRRLVELAAGLCAVRTGSSVELVSGPGHDAVEIARVVPTAMVFAPSIAGVSHAPEEDTDPADLRVALEVFFELALTVLDTF
jgi:N-carbamoyl-L-amino-acid hydrolase